VTAHHHPHGHDHGRPHGGGALETITHVHGGPMVLDIGGTVGALHVLLDDAWAGREVFLATADPAFAIHTGVWRRHAGGAHVASALFATLEAGRYEVLGHDGAHLGAADVRGGELTEIDLVGAC
jgi:hypothetical protein